MNWMNSSEIIWKIFQSEPYHMDWEARESSKNNIILDFTGSNSAVIYSVKCS